MHRKGFVHRDLKMDNIMYMPLTKTIKFIDFRIACLQDTDVANYNNFKCTGINGATFIQSPELHELKALNKTLDTSTIDYFKQDLWAIGIIIFVLTSPEKQYEYYKKYKKLWYLFYMDGIGLMDFVDSLRNSNTTTDAILDTHYKEYKNSNFYSIVVNLTNRGPAKRDLEKSFAELMKTVKNG